MSVGTPLLDAARTVVCNPAYGARPTRRSLLYSTSLATLVSLAASSDAHGGKCTIARLPDIPVEMRDLKPMVHAQINGTDALFVADSGSFFNFLSPAAATALQLHASLPLVGVYMEGVGGFEQVRIAQADTFTIVGQTVPNVQFVVAEFGGNASGLLGQNFFRVADVEYDLANGVIRLVQPKDCKGTPLAYWAGAANKPYSVIDIESATAREPHTRAVAYLNGAKLHVVFDTGASASTLTLDAAKRAGITPASPGVTAGGAEWGVGRRVAETWIARFASFKIGDEEIQSARLRFGDINLPKGDIHLPSVDMLIGADFFLSHRVYVASSQGKLYFTYNGGPVFDLTVQQPAQTPVPRGGPPAVTAGTAASGATNGGTPDGATDMAPPATAMGSVGPAAATGAAASGAAIGSGTAETLSPEIAARLDQPTDAAGYARRGAASAARHDYQSAIADFTRASALQPAEASYLYERGMAHWHASQADAALGDLDQAIKLRPDEVDYRLARAALHVGRHEAAAAAQDLEAVDRIAPKDSDAQLRLGEGYAAIDQPAIALVHYSRWIDTHSREHPTMASVLNSRCWALALLGKDLDQALTDCNQALKKQPDTAAYLDSRGLVYLRQNKLEQAIADYDAALRLQPKLAWSLYGCGLAKLRQGKSAEGQADLAAAEALAPQIAAQAAKYGLHP